MDEDTEYLKLPAEEQCVHKLWKARLKGYESACKLFQQWDEKAPEFNKYAPLIKKFVIDSNAVAQEKGIEAATAFVECAHVAGRICGDVVAGVVLKAIAAPKTSTREKARELVLMCVEIEKQEVVQEELVKGFSQKNPKVVAGCISTLTAALSCFGHTILNLKALLKLIPELMEHKDKTVREETKALLVELHRWISAAIKPQLANMKPVLVSELEAEFEKNAGCRPQKSRLLRSQQQQQQQQQQDVCSATDDADGDGDVEEDGGADAVDPLDLIEPFNVLAALPKDFHAQLESKKWQERKEALTVLLDLLTKNPKIEPADYAEVVKALRRIISKDSNVVVVALAGQCMAGIARGLRRHYAPYAVASVATLLDKFKEKKQNVVTALREAADAIFPATSLEAIQEDVCTALGNKNPSVRAETAAFVARSMCYCTPAILNKKLLKVYVPELCKLLVDSDPTVRDSTSQAVATAWRLVGERLMTPFMPELESSKLDKIKELAEKVELKVKVPAAKATAVKSVKPGVAGKQPAAGKKPASSSSSSSAANKRPATAGSKKTTAKQTVPDTAASSCASSERELSDEQADELVVELLTETTTKQLADSNWKLRMAAIENALNMIGQRSDVPTQAIMRVLVRKPGLKDNNFQVLRLKIQLVQRLAENTKFSTCSAELCVSDLVDRLPDTKTGSVSADALLSIAESVTLQPVGVMVLQAGFAHKSPKVHECCLAWINRALLDFGLAMKPKLLLEYARRGLSHTTLAVRNSSVQLLGTVQLFIGAQQLRNMLQDEKPSALQLVEAEIQRLAGEKAPTPTRGDNSHAATDDCTNSSKTTPSLTRGQSQESLGEEGGASASTKTVRGRSSVQKASAKQKPGSRGVGSARGKKEDEVEAVAVLQVNNLKKQRIQDELKLRCLKWNFSTPRAEFIDQLKEQMSVAGVSDTLMSQMFHSDFKQHLKAIESLTACVENDMSAVISNLDLLLKWLTLRLFDTNPAVIIRGLDLFHTVFQRLLGHQYRLTEQEAAAFLPYLLVKFGESKETIRMSARAIIRQLYNVYAANKVFVFVMDALKSKNARQRAECLEELGYMIDNYLLGVCQPSPGAALKEIGRQIGDRDNGVRKAALNALLHAYYQCGDKLYRLIGNISDKDMSLLEERIKRAPPKPAASAAPVALSSVNLPEHNVSRVSDDQSAAVSSPVDADVIVADPVSEVSRPVVDNEITRYVQQLDEQLPRAAPPDVRPLLEQCARLDRHIDNMLSEPPMVVPVSNRTWTRPRASAFNVDELRRYIEQMTGDDRATVRIALDRLMLVLKSDESEVLCPLVDSALSSTHSQFSSVLPITPASMNIIECVLPLLKDVSAFIIQMLQQPRLAECCGSEALKSLLTTLLRIMSSSEASKLTELTGVVNRLIIRLIDKANHTNTVCCLVSMLEESVRANKQSSCEYQNLLMKCLWKLVRSMDDWASHDKLQPSHVLHSIEHFLVSFPSVSWKTADSDTPLRTVRTVLHRLATIYGYSILVELGRISSLQRSETMDYLVKVLCTTDGKPSAALAGDTALSGGSASSTQSGSSSGGCSDATGGGSDVTASSASTTAAAQSPADRLRAIFKMVSSKEFTQQGMNELYDFKQQHPSVSLAPFLETASPFFRNYVERGLKAVALERERSGHMSRGGGSAGSNQAGGATVPAGQARFKLLDKYARRLDEQLPAMPDRKTADYHAQLTARLLAMIELLPAANTTSAAACADQLRQQLTAQLRRAESASGVDSVVADDCSSGGTFRKSPRRSQLSSAGARLASSSGASGALIDNTCVESAIPQPLRSSGNSAPPTGVSGTAATHPAKSAVLAASEIEDFRRRLAKLRRPDHH